MTDGEALEEIAALLEDDCARTILAATSTRPMTATELTDRCDASGPTVYRRIETLQEQDLLESRTKPDTEGGHHEQVYAATLAQVNVTLRDGTFEVQVDRRESLADRFTRLVEEM